MALYLDGSNRGSGSKSAGIKRAAVAVLGAIIAAGVLVLGFFALTAAMAVAAVAFLIGAIWWKFSGKKRFEAATRQAFNSAANADFGRTSDAGGHTGRVIEGEVVRRE